MACFWLHGNKTTVEIPSTQEEANVTYYKIKISVAEFNWTVLHRYSEFHDLHHTLVVDHGVSKDILPAKSVIRNKSSEFVENRRKGLECYLQKVFVFLQRTMPKPLVDFLHFYLYDVFFLLQNLSRRCFLEADDILSTNKPYNFTVLELHALSEYLRKPFPLGDSTQSRLDLSPILDLCSQLSLVKITGSFSPYLHSNIILNKLPFECSSFKILKTLYTRNIAFPMIFSLGNLRTTLERLYVDNANASSICDILQCDVIHKYNLNGSQKWARLETLDLSNNNLTEIDNTISLAPQLKTLILNNNKISTISNITKLSNLTHLSLCKNLITVCNALHTKVGNILTLNLSQNNIVSTKGFGKLYSLETLDLSCNKITDINEIQYLGDLPCLENIIFTGNSVATAVDYRIKVLEFFGERTKCICLDNEIPSQAELDKVAILRALRIVKEGKTPNLTILTCD
ncbi:hypothetical protein NQ317_018705 [Molorchus minor]|uniref:PX domain-containing protein n=1 Tax=Molorchus minor TaxID=1323400 RepID=A0ABQ9JRD7_9CUCU|nr:hypothetical protein NQ317_018705 [Molorchus minor]